MHVPTMKVSIIIPVLNEEENLPHTLEQLQEFRREGHEVVIVDGGSSDNSLLLVHDRADIVIVSQPGRAAQMNNGAAVATGNVLLFLHADSVLPDDAVSLILSHADKKNLWGRFDIRLSSKKHIFRLIESLVNLRSRLTSIATGDQAIFVERKLFDKVAGFPEIALMEDITLSGRLKKISSPICLRQKVLTSSRRWEKKGVIATVLLMWKLRLYYFFGVSPEKLKQLYR